eukprot:scaffold6254_cov376-Prasinococcus_capsulatus_cf.AAC.4
MSTFVFLRRTTLCRIASPGAMGRAGNGPGDAALVEGAARLGAGETTHIHNGIVVREGEFEVDGRCSHAEGDPEIALAIALHHHAS